MPINTTRGILRTLTLLGLFIFAPTLASAATYYVAPTGNDGNAGTSALPWRTFAKAAGALVAGDTAIFKNGTYTEPGITFNNSGNASLRITFKAENSRLAILASSSACNPAFTINSSYVTVDGIRFTVAGSNEECGFYTSNNLAIRSWGTNITIRDIKVDYSSQRALGVKCNGDFSIVENSEIEDQTEFFNVLSGIIRNNIITGGGHDGVLIQTKGGSRNVQVYNNTLHMISPIHYGIKLGGSSSCCHFDASGIEAFNSVAYNNVVINETGGNVAALDHAGSKDSAFFNNVVIGGQLAVELGGPNENNGGVRPPSVNPTFKNNIISCNGKPATSGYFGWDGAHTGTRTIENNNFYNCSGGVPAQTNAIVGNPLFVDPASDWHLQAGSPAIHSGTVASMGVSIDVSHDKDGVVRTTPWDLGIYHVGGACTQAPLTVSSAASDGGFSYIIGKSFGTPADNSSNANQSTLRVFEGSLELGPAHALHADIRNLGVGRFSHWSQTNGTGEALRLSAANNSDPRTNGKSYTYCVPAIKVFDTTPPTVPTGLTTVASASQVSLSWNASTDASGVTGYRVYRNGTQIAAPASNSYIDGNLVPDTYSYTVAAVDAAGNVSAQSGSVSATVVRPPGRLRLSLASPVSFNAAAEEKT